MKGNIFYFVLFLLLFSYTKAQQVYLSDTKGELTVNGMGAANYKVPIAIPPGIKDVAPQVALTYSSSGNNGIAGYGWNIVGISSITRTGTRIDIDGYVDGVDFDDNDQFALDGQRLIKDGSKYFTENYSNLKIESTGTYTYPGASGTGPEKFTITFADGTQAFYGSTTNSRGVSEWLIDKWIDPQGNTIEYEYASNNNVTYIRFIRWSKNAIVGTNGYENLMEFVYKNRARPEMAYLHGVKMTNNWLLDRIEVKTGGDLFRKYQLTHIENELKYQNISQIQEFNGNNEPANPVLFSYNSSTNDVIRNDLPFDTGLNINDPKIEITGDFDGDGKLDVIADGQLYRNLFQLGGSGSQSGVGLSNYAKNIAVNTLENGKILQSQAIVAYSGSTAYGNMSQYPNLEQEHTFSLKPQKLNTSNNTFSEIHNRTFLYPHLNKTTNSDGCMNNPNGFQSWDGEVTKKYIEGDFNGDGLSEIIILGKQLHIDYYVDPNPEFKGDTDGNQPIGGLRPEPDCNAHYYNSSVAATYVNMNPLIPDSESFGVTGISYDYDNDKFYTIDFDGDGKTEIMVMNKYGNYRVFRYKNQEVGRFEQITSGVTEYRDLIPEPSANETDVLLIGDFNGDGKSDLLVPTAVNSTTWKIYYSTGKDFVSQTVTLDSFERYRTEHDERDLNYYNYYALDIDKDGKSDYIKMFLGLRKPYGTIDNTDSRYQFWVKRNMNSGGSINFVSYYDSGFHGYDSPNLPVPITGSYRNASANYELLIMRSGENGRLITHDFKKDQSQDARLNSVSELNGKILSELTYAPLTPNTANGGYGDVNGTYFSSNSENYPFTEIKELAHVNVVTKLKVSAMGKSKEREFKYFGLTSHSHGWGILGFKVMAQSSWVTSGINTKIWQVNHMAPSLRGASIGSWSFSGNNLSLITNPVDSQLLSRSGTNYITQTLTQNRYVQLPELQWQTDFLTGVTSTDFSEFDAYYNVKKTTSQKIVGGTPQATYTTDYTYANNPSGTGTSYYIGRLTKKNTTATAYGDTRTSEVKYTYTGTLLTKTETKGHNTDYITETIQYDGYGNVTQKTTSAPGVSSRTISDEYDNNGRFVKKKTDIDGLITNFTYNKLGQVLTIVDPFNVTTTSTYDNWGKLMTVTIAGASTTPIVTTNNYSRDTNGLFIVSSDNAQTKEYSETHTDVLGRTIKSITKGFGSGTKIAKTTEYDFLGRVTRESEPYFTTGSPTQWNTVEYDNLSRPIKQTAFTGKVTNISYSGLSVTTTENGKTKIVTKDAIGNVASVSDNGQVLNYGYYANNELKSTTYGSHTVTIGIDGWGRKTSLLDPSVSTTAYTYSYNNYGEILQETTPNGITTYTYTPTGKLNTKTIIGENTNISVTYQYNTKGLITQESGTSNGTLYATNYYYDSLHRLNRKQEWMGDNNIEKLYAYDDFGRISTETTNVSCVTCINVIGASSSLVIKNNYNSYNGILDHITDNGTNATIWKLTDANQRMQTLSAQLGNGVNIANTYTTNGYIQNIRHTQSSVTPLSLDYTFDAQKGTLTNRKNNFYNYTENFTYDNFDRLLSWTTPTGVESNVYEPDGRIQSNSNIGSYSYDTTAKYKKKDITLTTNGKNYYTGRNPQTVIYNAFKKPVLITEEGRGSIEFRYGIYGVRNKAVEWTKNPSYMDAEILRTKLYSSDGTVEIILKGAEGGPPDQGPDGMGTFGLPTEPFLRIITYIGGNAYSAPAMYVTTYTNASSKTNNYHYLHRDFQGSIMAITNQAGTVLERRHYDAWGNVSKFTNASGLTQTNPNLMGGEMFFDRGYTGHEHFFRVGIIHMNGRIYDPVLKGFMSPDNFVQDPQNSQNFNRYAYCLNNPLMYIDQNGEEFTILGLGIAATVATIIAAASYTWQALTTWMEFSPMGLYKSATIGAISGMASYGTGTLAAAVFPAVAAGGATVAQYIGHAALSSGLHGFTQGMITGISGGSFEQGLWAGAISSVVSSATVGLNNATGLSGTAGDVSTMFFGTVSGGLSAKLSGGNFWQGAAIGLVVSGLNHVAHRENTPDNGYERDGNGGYRKINDKGGDETDYLYENGQIVESRKVVQTAHEMERRTYGIKPPGSYALIDPTGDIVYGIFGGGLELKAGWGLLKFGTTRLLKSDFGVRVVLGGSDTMLKSSYYFEQTLKLNGKLPVRLPTLYGPTKNIGVFLGRNTALGGGLLMLDGMRRIFGF